MRSENPSENQEMADVTEASELLREHASPVQPGELIAHQIRRAARKAGLTASRAKAIWYGEARKITAHEMDALRKNRDSINEIRETIRTRRGAAGADGLSLDRRSALALAEFLTNLAERLPE